MSILLPENKAKTKSGLELEFEFYWDDTRKNSHKNERWIYHTVEAFVNQNGNRENVGYLRLAYIDDKKKEEFNADVLMYARNIKGAYWLDKLDSKRLDEVTEEKLNNFSPIDEYTKDKTFKQRLNILKKGLNHQYKKTYESFLEYHYLKPEPDYSSVNEEYRRKGIAQALYIKAAELMGLNGLPLYQSFTQTTEATGLWDFLKQDTEKVKAYKQLNDKDRFYLDYTHLKPKEELKIDKRKRKIKLT